METIEKYYKHTNFALWYKLVAYDFKRNIGIAYEISFVDGKTSIQWIMLKQKEMTDFSIIGKEQFRIKLKEAINLIEKGIINETN